MKFNCDYFVLVIYLIIFSVPSQATYGAQTWSFEQVSPPIYKQDQTIQQSFTTTELKTPPKQKHHIIAVQVQTHTSSSAWIESRLCTASHSHCINIPNGNVYSRDFNRLPATTPLVVIHQLKRFNGAYPPIFIKTQLNIWWQ